MIVLADARRPSADDFAMSHRANGIAGGQHPLDLALLAERISGGDSNIDHGYRQPAFVFDDGWILADALRFQFGRLSLSGDAEKPDDGVISLVPFIDTGRDWNNEVLEGPTNDAWSVGAGIGWQINNQTDLRFGVDLPLVSSEALEGGVRQDLGFQFRLATEFSK
ncbi:MAG: hypothetical protein ACR2Q4_09060 [Geminicoccaceae bacterium]